MQSIKEKNQKSFDALKADNNYENTMEAPRLVKAVVSVGIGKMDENKRKVVLDRLEKITGQKPAVRGAKQSIATFKLREGDPVGYQVTLRGKRMHDFLDRLLNIALPRAKDFRGVSRGAIDDMGNYTLGLREHTIFPETSDEELKDIFGMSITIVTTATSKREAEAFLTYLGMPFRKAAGTGK